MNSEKAEELLDMASEITVHSGNIASWNKLRRKGALSPTAEVSIEWSLDLPFRWYSARGTPFIGGVACVFTVLLKGHHITPQE